MNAKQRAFSRVCYLLATAQSERELRSRFMDTVSELLPATSWGIALFDDAKGNIASLDVTALPETFLDAYRDIGWRRDAMMRTLVERHIPVHNLSVLPPKLWQHSMIYQELWSRYSFEHGLMAPLLGQGQIIGKIHFLRTDQSPSFNATDLQTATALSTHLSVTLATLRASTAHTQDDSSSPLTSRERQVADLVAQGLNNVDIGDRLGISHNGVKQALKRMFCKLHVSTRTEMIAKLSRD